MATGPQRPRAPRKPGTPAVNPIKQTGGMTAGLGKGAKARPAGTTRPAGGAGFTQTGRVAAALPAGAPPPGAAPVVADPAAAPSPVADPRDGTYTGGVTALTGRIAARKAQLGLDGARQKTDLATSLDRMAKARAGDLTKTNSNSNREGLYFSTLLGQRRGEVEGDYRQREDDVNLAAQRATDDRATEEAGLGEVVADPSSPLGYRATGAAGLELQGLFEAAVQRQILRDEG